jgi:hypothetical protein
MNGGKVGIQAPLVGQLATAYLALPPEFPGAFLRENNEKNIF